MSASTPDENLRLAWDFVERTGVSIFLTGKAGTGKTTFLRQVMKNSSKTAVVVAPTGVAAMNAGGVTIHSFFQISPAPYIPGMKTPENSKYGFSKQKLRVIRSLDLLVIDEISMVRADLLDALDEALRRYRRNQRPFGGVQLLMIGDLQQLAPVVTPRDEEILANHYSTPYFFGSHALAQIPYVTIRLEKVFRQQNPRFVELLNHVRDNLLTAEDVAMLRSRLDPNFIPADRSGYIRLTTHNASADSYNDRQMRRLPTPEITYKASITGIFPESLYPTAAELTLKVGAQVMFIKNDTGSRQYYNGLIGTIVAADRLRAMVAVEGRQDPIEVTPQPWENTKYKINESTNAIETEIQGTFTQMPLRPAWAITIHKSQGLTFDKVVIDAGASFAPGQVYVALSRCRSLEGIVLATPIYTDSLRPDPAVKSYIVSREEEVRHSVEMLPQIRRQYHRALIEELFNFREISMLHSQLERQVLQIFSKMFPSESARLVETSGRFRSEVLDIADKWIITLRTMSQQQLDDPEFLQRIRNGAVYFYNKIVEIYGDLPARATKIKSENKKASQRVGELAVDLRQALMARLYLLRDINESGFTISNYLGFKQQALLKATRDPAEEARERRRREAEEERTARRAARGKKSPSSRKRQSEPKESTYEITLRLFRQGLSREEIARERSMAYATITGHLARYILTGEITLEEILSPIEIRTISSVLQRLGLKAGFAAYVEALPGVNPADIRLVATIAHDDGTIG